MTDTAKVIPLPRRTKLVCSQCGAKGEMGCGCGVEYIRAAAFAEKVVADPANAKKSSHDLENETGVSHKTFQRTRKSVGTNVPTQTRVIGADGKSYPARRKSKTPVLDRAREIVRPLVEASEPIKTRELAAEHGISHVQFETAVAAERAAMAERALHRDIAGPGAQEVARLAHFKRQIEAEFEQHVLEEVRKRLNEILPKYHADHAHYRDIIERRSGFMDRKTYNGILKRLHPDHGGDAVLLDAFVKLKNILLDEKESPTERDLVPRTFEELMERKRKADEKRRKG